MHSCGRIAQIHIRRTDPTRAVVVRTSGNITSIFWSYLTCTIPTCTSWQQPPPKRCPASKLRFNLGQRLSPKAAAGAAMTTKGPVTAAEGGGDLLQTALANHVPQAERQPYSNGVTPHPGVALLARRDNRPPLQWRSVPRSGHTQFGIGGIGPRCSDRPPPGPTRSIDK